MRSAHSWLSACSEPPLLTGSHQWHDASSGRSEGWQGRKKDQGPSHPKTQGTEQGHLVDASDNAFIRRDARSCMGGAAPYPLHLVSSVCALSHLQPEHGRPLNINLLQAGSRKASSPKESSLKTNSSVDHYA